MVSRFTGLGVGVAGALLGLAPPDPPASPDGPPPPGSWRRTGRGGRGQTTGARLGRLGGGGWRAGSDDRSTAGASGWESMRPMILGDAAACPACDPRCPPCQPPAMYPSTRPTIPPTRCIRLTPCWRSEERRV